MRSRQARQTLVRYIAFSLTNASILWIKRRSITVLLPTCQKEVPPISHTSEAVLFLPDIGYQTKEMDRVKEWKLKRKSDALLSIYFLTHSWIHFCFGMRNIFFYDFCLKIHDIRKRSFLKTMQWNGVFHYLVMAKMFAKLSGPFLNIKIWYFKTLLLKWLLIEVGFFFFFDKSSVISDYFLGTAFFLHPCAIAFEIRFKTPTDSNFLKFFRVSPKNMSANHPLPTQR